MTDCFSNSSETWSSHLSENSAIGFKKPAYLPKVFANPSTSQGKFHNVNIYSFNMNSSTGSQKECSP